MKSRRWDDVMWRATKAAVVTGIPQEVWAIPSTDKGYKYLIGPHRKRRFTLEQVRPYLETLPRCVQRARQSHGGGSKVALPYAGAARELARLMTEDGNPTKAYRCDIPSPAIGAHYHLATLKLRSRWP